MVILVLVLVKFQRAKFDSVCSTRLVSLVRYAREWWTPSQCPHHVHIHMILHNYVAWKNHWIITLELWESFSWFNTLIQAWLTLNYLGDPFECYFLGNYPYFWILGLLSIYKWFYLFNIFVQLIIICMLTCRCSIVLTTLGFYALCLNYVKPYDNGVEIRPSKWRFSPCTLTTTNNNF